MATGLASMSAFYFWVATTSASTGYETIAAQMVLLGTGVGLTSAPATKAIMGVVPQAKAGVGLSGWQNRGRSLRGSHLGAERTPNSDAKSGADGWRSRTRRETTGSSYAQAKRCHTSFGLEERRRRRAHVSKAAETRG